MISFKPLSLLRNCHLQTIVSSILPIKNSLKKTEEIILIPMKDGDRIQTKTNINIQPHLNLAASKLIPQQKYD